MLLNLQAKVKLVEDQTLEKGGIKLHSNKKAAMKSSDWSNSYKA
jgi:hypothetical protein